MKEIGCKAFVFILAGHNPKVYARSIECILIGYAKNSKAYRCYERATGKIYETYHVKFCKSHKDSPAPTHSTSDTNVPDQPSTLDSHDPITIDDNAIVHSRGVPLPQNERDGWNDDQQVPQPCQSNRIPVPTVRADPKNAPMSQTQKAVQESVAAGEQLRAQHEADRTRELEILNQETENHERDLVAPDLANIALLHDIECLLTATQGLHDHSEPDIHDEPRTWVEAKQSGDAQQWEAAYRDELKSLRDMGVYKLVPRAAMPAGQKVRTWHPVFKIKRDEHGNAVRFKVRLVF